MKTEGVDQRYLRFPATASGMTIGLFGGSFNPPHEGHRLVAETALKRLGLDQLWWMVTPGNPLKSTLELLPLARRIELSEAMYLGPRVKITAFEATYKVRFTADTLALIKARHQNINFIWVMGADNLKYFHHWQRWQKIAEMLPIAIIDRPGSTLSYVSSKMALTYDYARVDEDDAVSLGRLKAPSWTLIHGPRSSLSSSAIRAVNKLSRKTP
ncbi:MAG: nicotinate-nucleotide adenylyltransferase [Notoacmeibacter sp.]